VGSRNLADRDWGLAAVAADLSGQRIRVEGCRRVDPMLTAQICPDDFGKLLLTVTLKNIEATLVIHTLGMKTA
jgi:hypothetical protein